MLSVRLADKLENLRTTVLENHLVFSANFDEDFLERRFSKGKIYASDVKLEFSKDEDDLSQYYAIREAMYKTMLDYHEPIHLEDEDDKKSDILLAKHGDACVGGARLTISKPETRIKLPMERRDFVLNNLLKNIDLNDLVYSEVSRVASLPKYAEGEMVQNMYTKLVNDKKDSEGVKVVFFATYPIHARKIRQVSNALGFAMTKVHIDTPEHFLVSKKIKLSLYAMDLTEDSRYIDKLKNVELQSTTISEDEKELVPELA